MAHEYMNHRPDRVAARRSGRSENGWAFFTISATLSPPPSEVQIIRCFCYAPKIRCFCLQNSRFFPGTIGLFLDKKRMGNDRWRVVICNTKWYLAHEKTPPPPMTPPMTLGISQR